MDIVYVQAQQGIDRLTLQGSRIGVTEKFNFNVTLKEWVGSYHQDKKREGGKIGERENIRVLGETVEGESLSR